MTAGSLCAMGNTTIMAVFKASIVMPVATSHLAGQAMRRLTGGSGTGLAFLEHDRYAMPWEQLFSSLQGLGLISSEDRHHGDALGQVSDHVEQQAHALAVS